MQAGEKSPVKLKSSRAAVNGAAAVAILKGAYSNCITDGFAALVPKAAARHAQAADWTA